MARGKATEASEATFEDTVHESWGEFGRYQILLNLLLSICAMPCAMQMLSMNFLAAKTDFWCSQLEATEAFWDAGQWKNFTQSVNKDRCSILDLDYSDMSKLNNNINNNNNMIACSSFTHDTTVWSSTVVQRFDLVCDRSTWVPFTNSILMAAVGAGVVVSGAASDKYGRRSTLMALLVITAASGLAAAFVNSFPLWVFLRSVTYGASMSVNTVQYILRVETLSGRSRGALASIFGLSYALGTILLPLLALATMDSTVMEVVMAAANLPLIVFFLIIPESPRWLIGQGRHEEAKRVLTKGAKINGRPLPNTWSFESKCPTEIANHTEPSTFFTLFRTRRLRTITLCTYALWFGHGFVFYGIGLNAGDLGGNLFVTTFIFGLVDIPGMFTATLAFSTLPRRIVLSVTMVIAASCLMLTSAFPKGDVVVGLAMTAKFFLSVSFTGIYLYSAEVFPTSVRNRGFGSSSVCARLGSVLAPLTFPLSYFNAALFPTGLLGGVFILCAAGLALLPETFGKPLPKTVEELEKH